MNDLDTDHFYMARAIQLAEKGLYSTQPNPRVGCVIVRDGQIVGEGYHRKAGGPHAEIYALRQAAEKAKGATVYVSLEPCSHQGKTPPCADALIDAGVKRVLCAMQDPNPQVSGQGLEKLRKAGIEVVSGILLAQAQALNPGFIKRMQTGLPYVRVKLAMSLDGRTAMASGESKWITGESARADVQRLRARSSVILTGSATVLADDPSMNVRVSADDLGTEIDPVQPLRAVIDSQLKVSPHSQIFNLPGNSCVFTCEENNADKGFRKEQLVVVKESASQAGKVDLLAVFEYLAQQQSNEVHIEAGSQLCGALLNENLVDEIIVYMAPHIMGDSARGLFHLPNIVKMQQRIDVEIKDIRAIGADWRMTLLPRNLVA